MCLPIGCLKKWVSFIAFIIIGIGAIVCLFAGIKWTQLDDMGPLKDTVKTILIIVLIVGACLILVGIFGMIGASKENKFLLTIFQILVISFCVIFLLVGLIILFQLKQFSQDLPTICKENSVIIDLNKNPVADKDLFCTPKCPCNSTKVENKNVKTFNASLTIAASGPVNVIGCKDYPEDRKMFASFMGPIEKQFKCSGICTKIDYYIYSDVNAGWPTEACGNAIIDKVLSMGNGIGYGSLAFAGFMLINVIAICCLCFHPDKDKEHQQLAEPKK